VARATAVSALPSKEEKRHIVIPLPVAQIAFQISKDSIGDILQREIGTAPYACDETVLPVEIFSSTGFRYAVRIEA
jgi:hypothetical protein